jgi:hypothetical protein
LTAVSARNGGGRYARVAPPHASEGFCDGIAINEWTFRIE